jgi:hypothetical protein
MQFLFGRFCLTPSQRHICPIGGRPDAKVVSNDAQRIARNLTRASPRSAPPKSAPPARRPIPAPCPQPSAPRARSAPVARSFDTLPQQWYV